MQKRKMPKDANALAAQIVAMSTGQPAPGKAEQARATGAKNPAAVALGRHDSGHLLPPAGEKLARADGRAGLEEVGRID